MKRELLHIIGAAMAMIAMIFAIAQRDWMAAIFWLLFTQWAEADLRRTQAARRLEAPDGPR